MGTRGQGQIMGVRLLGIGSEFEAQRRKGGGLRRKGCWTWGAGSTAQGADPQMGLYEASPGEGPMPPGHTMSLPGQGA